MNLDGNISPVCVNIMPLVSTPEKSQPCLQIFPSQFLLLTMVERLASEGSLGGINALLGCPLHLPSTKYMDGAKWRSLSGLQKKAVCHSLYYAINWIRELVNAFSTQVACRVDNVSQKARDETAVKLIQRLRNLILLEGLLNALLKNYPLSLPELRYRGDYSGSTSTNKFNLPKKIVEESVESTSSNKRQKCREDKSASEKTNPDDNLKQPKILDAFKRAGVTISQETNNASSQQSSSGTMPKNIEQEVNDIGKLGIVDLMAAPAQLDMQRFKFRTLHITCLSLLNYSESQDSACSYHESELPVYVYLLRDLRNKLDHLNPLTKPFHSTSHAKYTDAHCHQSTQEFLDRIQPLFSSLRKHLDGAVSMIKDGSENCPDNWNSHSSSAGNPDIPFVVVPESSIVTSVCKEVLGCYRKLLAIPHLFNQSNMSLLKQLLQTLQPAENFDDVLSEFHPSLAPSNVDYLYCGAHKMLETIMEPVCSFSYRLASDVLITMQSILSSVIVLLEKSGEANGRDIPMRCSKEIIPFLQKHLAASARKLLTTDLSGEDAENGWQSKGDLVQKILQIYLKNSESTSDLLGELTRSVDEVSSLDTKSTQDASHGFPTLGSSTILSWYRVLHDENTGSLNKAVKQALKTRTLPANGSIENVLEEINKSVNVFVSLVCICKTQEKVSMHAVAVNYGGKFVETFLKAFNFLETQFRQHEGIIVKMLKELQKATRTIQTICSEAKGYKRTMITSKVPATKRSLERFLFQVKALLHKCSAKHSFEIGVLKHKDLQGQVVSSQVYGGTDDTSDEETDSDTPADENDNAMDEDVAEESNEVPMEE